MKKQKRYTGEKKVRILRELLENKYTATEICENYQIAPSTLYKWKNSLFANAVKSFNAKENKSKSKKIENYKNKLQAKDNIIAELVTENIKLKKNFIGGI